MTVLKAEHLNPFLDSARDAFTIMAGIELTRSNISLKKDSDRNADISGIIGLAGDVSGSIVLNFPLATAKGIVSKFLGAPVNNPRDYEALDAVGELTNIVAGGAKSRLSELGVHFNIGLPTIIIGHKHQVCRPRGIPTLCVHWETSEGGFILEVCLKASDPD